MILLCAVGLNTKVPGVYVNQNCYLRQRQSSLQPAFDILLNVLFQLPSLLLHIQLSHVHLAFFLPARYAVHRQFLLEVALDVLHLVVKLKSDD